MFHQATNVCEYFADMICIFSTPFAFFFCKGWFFNNISQFKKKKTTNVWPWACIDVKLAAYVEPYYSENRKLTKVVLSKSVNKKTKSYEQLFLHD
jgi:hypothetical protein